MLRPPGPRFSLIQHFFFCGRHLLQLLRGPLFLMREFHIFLMYLRQLATQLQIEGTPAFFVGDTVVPGADMEALKTAIAQVKAGDLKKPPAKPA